MESSGLSSYILNNGLDPKDSACITPFTTKYPDNIPLMQYTGLKDKNGSGNIKFYEGDFVSLDGKKIGNKYENPELHKDPSNLLIEGIGTKSWRATEKAAMDRGLGYAE